tara:strand:+ start:455 stop:841 length:387 start_codon:yes stop_codon:yes gene_type:complete
MNLKKQYQRLFEGRADFAKANNLKMEDALLNENPMVQAFPKMKSRGEMEKAGVKVGIDVEYFSDQLNELLTGLEDFHQELGTAVEMKGDETGDYIYDTAEKQISRYMMSAMKGLEDLQKYLERQKRNL